MKTIERISNVILVLFAIYLVYCAYRISLGVAIVVACLWVLVFMLYLPKKTKKYDKAGNASRTQNDLINNK